MSDTKSLPTQTHHQPNKWERILHRFDWSHDNLLGEFTLRHTPLPGDIYRHFKGNEYEIVDIAIHTETKEQLVIYKRCNNNQLFARPLEMFMSEVDKTKYPNITQKYRFELIYYK